MMRRQARIRQLLEVMARRMRSRRKTLGLTQEQLAEKADLGANYIAKLELADRIPSFSTLVSIADALDVEVFELLSVSKGRPGVGAAQEVERLMRPLDEEDAEFLLSELQNIAHYIKLLRKK